MRSFYPPLSTSAPFLKCLKLQLELHRKERRDVSGDRSRDLAYQTLATKQHPCSLTAALIKQII